MAKSPVSVGGFVAPGYQSVRDAFVTNFEREDEHRELGAALAAYKHGECVVDLWGGHADASQSRPWTADTLVNVWSTTKGITALAVAVLVERGLVNYGQRVAEIWPEFGAAGKNDVTVGEVMSHRAGLPGFEAATTTEDLYDWRGCCAKLADQAPAFTPGRMSCYHTVTYGYLAGEIVRRVAGRTVGQFIGESMAQPLSADFYVGLPAIFDARVAELVPPKALPDTGPPSEMPKAARMSMQNPALDPRAANTRSWRAAEIPAVNGHASARGIARLFGMVANGGRLGSIRPLSPASIAAMSTRGGDGADLLLGFDPAWAMGVSQNPQGNYGSNPLTIGHSGWGGSFGCADTEAGLALGYVCNRMGSGLVADARTESLVRSFEAR
jgi:CubicO group peptidase (beta-lactamase class C family)